MFAAERSAGIDVLRGICVLLVTLHHIHLRFRHNRFDVGALLPQPIARVVFGSGYFAVITFFTISGFLITSLSLRRWASLDRIPLRQFYWLRFARIVPCLLLLVALLSVLHLAQVKQFVIPPERSSLGRAVLAALTFHVNWLEGHHGYLPGSWDVLWSLSVEEVFYLLFPVLCLSLRSVRWLLVPLIALILIGPLNRVALAGREPWVDYAYLSCMDGIAFGCLAALLTARLRLGRSPLRWMMAIGIVLVSLIVVFRGLSASLGLHQVGLGVTILELGVALMLIALAQGIGRDGLARGTGTLCMVGRSSYEIYLTHMLVILGLLPLILESKPEGSAIVVWYVGLLISSVALGWLVNKVYSEPLNRALRARLALLALLPLLFACAPVSVAAQPSAVLGRPAPVASIGANPTVTRAAEPATQLGLDVLAGENFARLRGAHVALLTNDTADGTRSLDALAAAPGVFVVALFTPEHGQAANKEEAIPDAVDERWSIPVYSLYGKQTSPDPELLRGVDTVVVDLPDAGVRFYTYASTVHGMLRVAAQLGLRVMLLDRPNPLNAVTIAGPMLDPSEASWVNHHALPIRHGMTLGELAAGTW